MSDSAVTNKANAGVLPLCGMGMFRVCWNFNPITRSQQKLIACNIEKHFTFNKSSNFAKGMTMLDYLLLRLIDFFEYFKAFA